MPRFLLLSLAFCTALLLAAPSARAGHWAITYTCPTTQPNPSQDTGTDIYGHTATPQVWTSPQTADAGGNGGGNGRGINGGSDPRWSVWDSKGDITPVLTWTKDQNEQTLPPAPAQISALVTVHIQASASGTTVAPTVSDTFGDSVPADFPKTLSGNNVSISGSPVHLVQVSNPSLSTTVSLPTVSLTVHAQTSAPNEVFIGDNLKVQIVTASLQAHSTIDTASWDGANPRFFSGTGCKATAIAVGTGSFKVKQVQLMVGAILTKEYDDTTSIPTNKDPNVIYSSGTSQASVTLPITFDSTHFADAGPIPVQMLVTDSGGNKYEATVKTSAYNEGYAGGGDNTYDAQSNPIGGSGAAQAVHDACDTSAVHIATTLGPSDNRSTTLAAIPGYSHYFTYTNGEDHPSTPNQPIYYEATAGGGNLNFIFGLAAHDNSSNSTKDGVDNWVGKKGLLRPPYNFVFLDVCNSLWNTDFAQGFGLGTAKVSGTDRAILGWKTVVENTPNNALWVNKLYTDLSNGFTLKAAIVNANNYQHLEQGSRSATPSAAPVSDYWGDNLMTLHNVYLNVDGQQSTKWFK